MKDYRRSIKIDAYTTSDDTIFDVRERIAESLSTIDDVCVTSIEVEDAYDPSHAHHVAEMFIKSSKRMGII